MSANNTQQATTPTSGSSSITDILGNGWNWLTSGTGQSNAALAALGGGIATLFGGNAPDPTGYQGKIPNYSYDRQMLPIEDDTTRRPGARGRRYFTDGRFTGGAPGEGMRPAETAQPAQPPVTGIPRATEGETQQFAEGGLASLQNERYLKGPTDGMADEINTTIDGKEPAKLSHGEFVIPADVVSHLGNGNSEAGAKILQDMMARIRQERTGTPEQGKQINPDQLLPM